MNRKLPLQERFNQFDEANPHLWRLFKEATFRAIRQGRTKLGAKRIAEDLRWDKQFHTSGTEFKICNDFVAYYARKFIAEFPQHEDIFELRRVQGDADDGPVRPQRTTDQQLSLF